MSPEQPTPPLRTVTVRKVDEVRAHLATPLRSGRRIGLVPTMGALHAGHLSLIRQARSQCDVVVVSLFVNPAQFNEASDLERYPRDEARDLELAQGAGADVLFAPSVHEVYPQGFSTSVEVVGISERLEGAARGPEHFRGVTTVVTKLLCMVMPDVAYFGRKDAQQVAVITRLATDLNLPVEIHALPTVREADGLAMSSRNALLDEHERRTALAVPAALGAAAGVAAEGERSSAALIAAARAALERPGVQAEYVALVDPESFDPVAELLAPALLAVAARVGSVRLIDNVMLEPAPVAARGEAVGCSA